MIAFGCVGLLRAKLKDIYFCNLKMEHNLSLESLVVWSGTLKMLTLL